MTSQPSRPTQPPVLYRMGKLYRPKCSDALRLEMKDRMAHSISTGQALNCDPLLTCAILSASRDEYTHDCLNLSGTLLTDIGQCDPDHAPFRGGLSSIGYVCVKLDDFSSNHARDIIAAPEFKVGNVSLTMPLLRVHLLSLQFML